VSLEVPFSQETHELQEGLHRDKAYSGADNGKSQIQKSHENEILDVPQPFKGKWSHDHRPPNLFVP
jgi:hypothetical protein